MIEPDILHLAEIIRNVDGNHDKGAAALAEAILSHPGWPVVASSIKPVPVSERLPAAEDMGGDGLSWWFDSSGIWVLDYFSSHYSHWLPYSALPLVESTP